MLPINFKDLTGQRFEELKLTVIGATSPDAHGHMLWKCLRDDGSEILRTGSYLTHYKPREKVLHPKRPPAPKIKPTPEYTAWTSMKQRCLNSNAQAYKDYGGRGITVCQRWQDSYEAFLEDVGPRPGKGYSLEREHSDGNYEPGNAHWATRIAQARNTRASRLLTHQGETLTVAGWAERLGIPKHTITNRLNQGLEIEAVFGPTKLKPRTGFERTIGVERDAWKAMLHRCTNPKHPAWSKYGGRGILVCERWLGSFDNFLADVGARPGPGYSLERKDVNGNYELDNCKWATRTEQMRNTRKTRWLTLHGVTRSLSEWAEVTGINYETIRNRLRKGLSVERVLALAV